MPTIEDLKKRVLELEAQGIKSGWEHQKAYYLLHVAIWKRNRSLPSYWA